MAHRTAFVHTKGGTGKTTACVNVAGFLQDRGRNVLVVDGDPEADATANLGLDQSAVEDSLHEVLLSEAGVLDADPSRAVYPTRHGIDVLPGAPRLHDGYGMLYEEDHRNDLMDEALRGLEDRYDHVLIDAPGSYIDPIAAAVRAAHDTYLVLDPSIFAQHGALALKRFLRKLPDRHRVPVNPTRALYVSNRKRGLSTRLRELVLGSEEDEAGRLARNLFGRRLVEIPYIEGVVRSQQEGAPLSHLDRTPRGAEVFEELAEEIDDYRWG